MATVHVSLGRVGARAETGATLPILYSVPRAAQTLTSSAVSTAATLVAEEGEVWTVSVTGGDVLAHFDADPEAGPNSGYLLLAGQPRDLAASVAGEMVAFVNVP